MIQVIIYGDSIMKGATPEGASKYRSVLPRFLPRLAEKYDLAVINRSRFGCTIDRGYAMLQKDLQEKTPCQIALVEYGGNDCDFDWKAIAADPTGEHKPKTSIESFVKTLETMAENLLQRNIQPLLMTLPPVDASRYLSFIWPGRLEPGQHHPMARGRGADDLPLPGAVFRRHHEVGPTPPVPGGGRALLFSG